LLIPNNEFVEKSTFLKEFEINFTIFSEFSTFYEVSKFIYEEQGIKN
jgi:hypothetical protein